MKKEVKELYNSVPYYAYGEDFFPVVKSLGMNRKDFSNFAHDKNILEVGCGGGQISVFFASNFKSVTGFDISKESLKLATKEAESRQLKNIEFLEADLFNDETINRFKDKFDMVCCYGVLHHTKNPREGFSRLIQMVKPGGVVLIGVYSRTRIGYYIKRKIVLALAGDDWEKRERIANRLWFKNKASKIQLFDGYVNPQVSFHSIRDGRNWIKENNLEYVGSWPPFETKWYLRILPQWDLLTELIWVLSGKQVMVSLTAKKKS